MKKVNRNYHRTYYLGLATAVTLMMMMNLTSCLCDGRCVGHRMRRAHQLTYDKPDTFHAANESIVTVKYKIFCFNAVSIFNSAIQDISRQPL